MSSDKTIHCWRLMVWLSILMKPQIFLASIEHLCYFGQYFIVLSNVHSNNRGRVVTKLHMRKSCVSYEFHSMVCRPYNTVYEIFTSIFVLFFTNFLQLKYTVIHALDPGPIITKFLKTIWVNCLFLSKYSAIDLGGSMKQTLQATNALSIIHCP